MIKHVLIVLVMLISLSILSSVCACDLNNFTSDLTRNDYDFKNLTIPMEPDGNELKSEILTADFQDNKNFSSDDDSTVYLILDNDVDKENVYIGDYVTWIVSVHNLKNNKAKNVKVYNHLSEGLKYINYTSTKGTFNPDTGIWDIGDVLGRHREFLYITALAVSVGEQMNKAILTTNSINLNNETYEEEMDVHDRPHSVDKINRSISLNVTGNPVVLVLFCLFGCLVSYFKR